MRICIEMGFAFGGMQIIRYGAFGFRDGHWLEVVSAWYFGGFIADLLRRFDA